MPQFDVVVIGGGIAGLIAAGFASRAGARVLVLEAAPEFGGRARTRTVSGYRFNQGAHAFYLSGFLDNALRDLGVVVAGNAPVLAAGFFVSDSQLHRAPFTAEGLSCTTLLSDAEKTEMASLFRRLRKPSAEIPPGTSLDNALVTQSPSPKIRSVLGAMTRLTSLVHAPKVADGQALLDQLRGGLKRNALYLHGGWGTMIEGLMSSCVQQGGCLRSSSRVASVENDGAGWHVMLAGGAAVAAGAVVLAVDPAQAAALCPMLDALHHAAEVVPANVACLDIGLAQLPQPEVLFALGVDRPLYVSVHSAAAELAPEGAALVHVLRYLEPGEKLNRTELIAELEGFLELIQPGWRGYERARQFLPIMPAISSIPRAAGVGMRPHIAVQGARGLFVCGDWVGSAGMLADAAAASGRSAGETAAALARELTV